jgi:16S rRNA (cytosine967-C5)-methyltransferase
MNPTPLPPLTGDNLSARALALKILLDCQRRSAFVQEILDEQLGRSSLAPPDRRLVTQLTYGVLRRRGTLDALLQPLLVRRRQKVESWLWEALRLGAYQLALLTHVPAHAVLNETVELAAVFGRPDAKGFLNGVLRSLSRLITDDRTASPSAYSLPLEDGHYRRFERPVFPDPSHYFMPYLSAAFALPRWLAERWTLRYSQEECLRLGFWFAGPAPLWLRCNPLKVSREQCLRAFADAGIAAEPGEHPQSLRLQETRPVRDLPGYAEGWFTVQDESSMQVASALTPQSGSVVLDLCAAPGGKATHLAELTHDSGQVIACDVDERRLQTVTELAGRLGLSSIETRLLRLERGEEPPFRRFDAVLVDVPCSNTGVLGRRPEVRWRLRPEDFPHLVKLQTRLLRQACQRVKRGGAVVYSTCSIEPEENGAVVRAVLKEMPEFTLEAEEERTPGKPADGGYWARLRRQQTLRMHQQEGVQP